MTVVGEPVLLPALVHEHPGPLPKGRRFLRAHAAGSVNREHDEGRGGVVPVDRQSWAVAEGGDEIVLVLGGCRGEAEHVSLQGAGQHHGSLPALDRVGHHLHGRGQEGAGVVQGQMALRDVTVPIHHDGPWAVGHGGRVEANPEPDRSGACQKKKRSLNPNLIYDFFLNTAFKKKES